MTTPILWGVAVLLFLVPGKPVSGGGGLVDVGPYLLDHDDSTALHVLHVGGDTNDWFRNVTREDIVEEYGCEDRDHFPLHNPGVWELLRSLYYEAVGGSDGDGDGGGILHSMDGRISGFVKNVSVQLSPGRGRGVFALERIEAGSWVWKARETSVRFRSGNDYRRYLASVPDELMCDVVEFTYVNDIGHASSTPSATLLDQVSSYETLDWTITVDLEDGAYINANWDVDENLRFAKDVGFGHLVALRDIEPGEELIVDYADFANEDGWDIFGL
jgi:SET domain